MSGPAKSMRPQPGKPRLFRQYQRGQAILEFALIAPMLVVMALAVVDFSRAIYDQQVITHLTREGSDVASRGSSASDSMNAVLSADSPLNLANNGCVIVTAVTNNSGVLTISDQASSPGCTAGSSKVGTGIGAAAVLPAAAIPPSPQSVFVTEVFYTFTPWTPIGSWLGAVLPSQMYDIAYF
jgi:Flp pilus assembly protein TadG